MSGAVLAGRTILVVEDEYFQAMDAKNSLEQAGAEIVGPSGNPAEIATLLDATPVDAALVDVNLGGGLDFAVADALKRRGIPFLFLTGYDCHTLPAEVADVPCLTKPASAQRVVKAVCKLIEKAPAGAI